jgi:SpoVK/Ycf46/Vps4 family AAA+-type ATPase
LRLGLCTPKLDARKEIDAIVKKIVPMTKGFSGARLRQLCDESKRNAMKRTGFTQVAAPTIADVLVALDADKTNKAKGKENG